MTLISFRLPTIASGTNRTMDGLVPDGTPFTSIKEEVTVALSYLTPGADYRNGSRGGERAAACLQSRYRRLVPYRS